MTIWNRLPDETRLEPPHSWSDGQLRRALIFGAILFWVILVTLLLY